MSVESIDPKTLAALLTLHDALKGRGVPWTVMGSLSHALQGLQIQPNDIDITTDRKGAHTIQHLLQQHVTRPVTYSQGDGVRSHLGELVISGVTVQIIGDMETSTDNGAWTPLPDEDPITVLVHGAAIPIHSLEWEVEIYTRLNRMERVERLRELIARKKHTPQIQR
jgi:hypothetical protein